VTTQPPLMLLHGFLGRGDDWAPVCAHLSHACACLTPDLPGHGRTALRPGPQSYTTWAAALAAMLDAQRLPQVVLVGYSLGGRVALAFAARYPQRVKALLLVSAHPGLREAEARRARRQADARRAQALRTDGLPTFLDAWYRLPVFGLETPPASLLARRRENRAEDIARVIAEMSPGVQPPLWDALARLPLPVGYVAGARDAKYAALARQIQHVRPDAQVWIFPNTGHMVHLEAPHALAEVIATVCAW